MDYTDKSFSEALAEILKKRHIKLRSLGAKTNLNYSYFSKIISEKKVPPIETITNIAQALEIKPEFFVEYRIHKICEILYNNPEFVDEVNVFIYKLQKEKITKVAENKEDYIKK
jgi:transcriptional regulator with XRE-family HTH domain